MARTGWSSSASTRRSSRSSAIRPTSPRRSPTSASAIRSRSTIATALERAQEQLLAGALLLRCAGRLRYHHYGEGEYDLSERVIRQLLAEAGHAPAGAMTSVSARRRRSRGRVGEIGSPETYIGYYRAERFARPAGCCTTPPKTYAAAPLALNQWALEGRWTDQRAERALACAPERRSVSASTRATCTWCSARRPASRCASA